LPFDFQPPQIKIANVPTTAASADPSLTAAFGASRAICRQHAKNLYFASFFLPKHKRNGVYAVSAFCGMIREAIDQNDTAAENTSGCCGGSSLDSRLALFRDRLAEIYSGTMQFPNVEFRSESQHILFATARTIERFEIPQECFLDWAEHCRMDLAIKRYATWNNLEKYCLLAGGATGRMLSCIFGLRHSNVQQYAVTMGVAISLTKILRDLRHDHRREKIYLPLEDLARFGYTERQLTQGIVNDSFRRLMKFEVARARQLYREGSKGLCWLADDGSRLSAATMAIVSAGVLDAIERQHYDVFRRRACLTTGQKLRSLPASWRLAKREDGEPMPRVF
jgi:15-cis-phytoene synthase